MADKIKKSKRLVLILLLAGITMVFEFLYAIQVLSLRGNTRELNRKAEELNRELVQEKNLIEQVKQLESKQEHAPRIPDSPVEFISYLDSLCNEENVRLISLPIEFPDCTGNSHFTRTEFSAEGSFFDLEKVLYKIEHQDRIAIPTRVRFRVENIREEQDIHSYLLADLSLNRKIRTK